MATATLQRHNFPEGTSVSAWPAQNSVNGGPPAGAAVATASVTGGVLTFTGLTVGVRYIAYAAGRGVAFRADETLGADAAAVGSPDRERLEFVEAALTTSGATGPAGGVLSGTYPDPGFAADMATQAELNAADSASAKKPATAFVQYVSTTGSDAADGLSPGTAKQTWAAAIAAFPAAGGDLYVANDGTYNVAAGVTIDGSVAKINVHCEPGTTLRATGAMAALLTYTKITDRPGIGIFGLVLDMNSLATVGLVLRNSWATDHHVRVVNVGTGTGIKLTTDDVSFGVYYNRVFAQVRGASAAGTGVIVEGQSGANAANDNAVSAHCTDLATGIKQGAFCDANMYRDCDVTLCNIGYDITSGYALLSSIHEEGTISAEGIVVRTGAIAQAEALYYEKTDVEGTGLLIMRYRGNVYTTFGGTGSPNIDTNFSNTGNWGMSEQHETSTGARVWKLDGVEVMRLNRNGTWTFANAVAAGSVANNTLFRDPATNLLAYKGSTGGVTGMESRGLKLPVRVAAPGNVTISAPGATIDGVTMAVVTPRERVLLPNQTTPSQNGLYDYNGSAVPMTRSPDSDTAAKLTDSLLVTVDEGTINRDSVWTLSTNKPITLETTSLRFTRVHPSYAIASHPPGSAYQPTNSKLENLDRTQVPLTNQAALATGTVRVVPFGVLRAGDSLAAVNFQIGTTAAATVTNSWAGIARLSDRVILAISPTSAVAPGADTLKTFTFNTPFTADKDETLIAFVMYQATTVPSLYGINHGGASVMAQAPVMNGTADTGKSAPMTVGTALAAFTADTELPYTFAT